MEFKKNAEVVTRDGDKIGTLDRIVMDPQTKQAGYLVVRSGFLLTEDKLIPIKQVRSVTEERIEVDVSSEAVDDFPRYEEVEYIAVDQAGSPDEAELSYWYPPAGGWSISGRYTPFPQPLQIERVGKNIRENMIGLKQGAEVFASDGEHVGSIERMFTDENNDLITHLVVSTGLLHKERKLIPAYWLTEVTEEEVHLAVDAAFLERLPEFHIKSE
ncbi:MAG TPA: PRC-barrel domain-containing protein [Anaerolineales bacterium]|nr:PRC-barrel domain-containing protein [Anaerolineales bacterium]